MPEPLLAKTPAAERARERAARPEAGPSERPEQPLVCRRCATAISDARALFAIGADTPVRVFANPAGLLREVLTARAARNLTFVGPPTEEFTWFPGYAWEAAFCAGCENHLGWRYSSPGGSPPEFFGLLTSELADRPTGML